MVFVVGKPAAFRSRRAVVLRRSGRSDAFFEARACRSNGLAALEGWIAGGVPEPGCAASVAPLSVPDPAGRVLCCKVLGVSLSVPDPKGRVLCCKVLGFALSVRAPEGRVLCCK